MLTIVLKFPWGRYYAHPWGINPGRLREAEWPPSPWRLLRALISGWFRANPGQEPNAECQELIEALARECPNIGIGKVSFSQTVHWQPNYGATSKPEQKREATYKVTRHENHFVAVHGPIIFRWSQVELSESQLSLLSKLLGEVTYFGRAESLCYAVIGKNGTENLDNIGWCTPRLLKNGMEQARFISPAYRDVFCPNPSDFSITDLWNLRSLSSGLESTNAPPHLVDQLLKRDMETDGALLVSYRMPDGWPEKWVVRSPQTVRRTKTKALSKGPKAAHYLCFSLQCRVPLLPKFIVPLAEQFRKAASSSMRKVYGQATSSFAIFGHVRDRPENLVGEHQHAFYLPMGRKGNSVDFLRDLHVWCPVGFTQSEIEIFLRIHRLNWGSGKFPVRPVLTAICKNPPIEAPFSTGETASRLWRCVSPFVPPRHFYRGSGKRMKLRPKDTPELQLIKCLQTMGITTPGKIRLVPQLGRNPTDGQPRWEIVRVPTRNESEDQEGIRTPVHSNVNNVGTNRKERRVGFFFEIEFDQPVALPVPSLGHSSHFGLGLFLPADSA